MQDIYCDQFDSAVFNKMYDIDEDFDCRPEYTAKTSAVLKAIAQQGITKHLGVWYPHNHFHVEEDERVVSHPVKSNGEPMFGRLAGEAALQTSVFKLVDIKDMVPATLYFSEGRWWPVQYIDKSVPGAEESYEFFMKHATEFLSDLTQVMKDAGLGNRMGLALRNDMSLKRKDDRVLSEKTDHKARVQRFYWQAEQNSGDLFVTYYCIDDADVGDFIKAYHDKDESRILKVQCRRAHCGGKNCGD